ncbi:phage shock protein operon transcriptional activator [Thermaurantiacus sp.]
MVAKPTQLVGQASAFLDAVERASAVAALNRPVLVVGERGTGKEMIAERLHRLSPRWEEPLVAVNCAALPESLLDAELFGHEAGAFTGAGRARAGRFEEADGGTLFLDEIATLTAAGQERLLRVIEYGELVRLGSSRAISVDVRVVAATNADLPALVARGQFRADLLDRLSFEVITLPPLRHRREDIPLLADFFGRRMASEVGWQGFPGFTKEAMDALLAHDWPGNVRELRNVVERSVYRSGDPNRPVGAIAIDPFASPWRPQGPGGLVVSNADAADPVAPMLPADFRASVREHERWLLAAAMERARHNQRRAAVLLGLSYDQLRHALRRHGMLGETADAPA